MLTTAGTARPHWAQLSDALSELGADELQRRQQEAARLLHEDGAVYHTYGEGRELWKPWELDAIPTVLPSLEWGMLERGIIQRAELLSLILEDLYGPRELLRRGLIPPAIVLEHDGFLRACDRVRLPTAHQLFQYATDLGRDHSGTWVILTDRTQAPSGFGYALENREVMSRVLPSLYRGAGVHRLEPFFRTLRSALLEAAPPGVDEPRVVVLTPGPLSETAFEHALLSTRLGHPLVEAGDLVVRQDGVFLQSPGQLDRVDVILRRTDASYCDPLELKADSQLGVAGLVEATRRGVVSVVNTLGSGVLENAALMRLLPQLSRHLLGEELRLPSVASWWCGDQDERSYVLDHLDQLILRPTSRHAGAASIFGPGCSTDELDALRRRINAHPSRWIAQLPLDLSDTPTLGAGGLEPRRGLLRAFAVARGDTFSVLPGGLTRVAPADDRGGPISGQSGAIAKDTWVITSEPEPSSAIVLPGGPLAQAADPLATLPAGTAENLWWLGRYAERAESTARLLRAVSDRRGQFLGGDDDAGLAALSALRQTLSTLTDGPVGSAPDPWEELLALVTDERHAGSLAFDVHALLGAAYAARDHLSGDTWLVAGDLSANLAAIDKAQHVRAPELQGAVQRVLQGLLALAGLGAESMVHDLGWYFLDAGRRLERALHVTGLLRTAITSLPDGAAGALVLESLVDATENSITYRRRSQLGWHVETILDLVLLDPANPRSATCALAALERDLAAIPRDGSRLRSDQRLVAQAATALRTCDPAALVDPGGRPATGALASLLGSVHEQLLAAGAAIEHEHFLSRLPQRRMTTSGWTG